MKKYKFNSIYRHNCKQETEVFEKRVNDILSEPINPQTLDFLFRYNARQLPKHNHELLALPGEFDEVKDSAILMLNQTAKQADYIETVTPDGKMVLRDSANAVEHLTGILKNSKAKDIHEYWLSTIISLKRLCYPVVVTDKDYKQDYIDYEIEGLPFRIFLRTYNREKIYEILNKLKEKDYSKCKLSDCDYLKMIYCMIFSNKEFAKDVITQITYLFATMEYLTEDQLMNLFVAIKMMIKFRFQDDLKTKKELITMIVKSIKKEQHSQLNSHETNMQWIDQLQRTNIIIKEENAIINKKCNDLEQVLSEKDEVLSKKDETILNNNKYIKKLEKIIESNNIII